jgi:hypothetical protein
VLYSFAITPEIFDPSFARDGTVTDVFLTELLRGLCDNGIVANLQAGQWMTQVRRCLNSNNSSPNLRDKLSNCLEVLHDRNRLIRHPINSERDPSDEFRWLRWALERHAAKPAGAFHAIVSTEEFIEFSELHDDVLTPINLILDAACWRERRRSVYFEKSEANLKLHLAPLVRHASKLVLIDPYMTCREVRFFNTVEHAASLLGRHYVPPKLGRIDIHAGNPMDESEELKESVNDRLERWKRELAPVVKHSPTRFRIFLWGRKSKGKSFHDRRIITDQCGLDAPGGLDFLTDSSRANYTTWTWLEPDDIQEILLTEFHEMKSPYRFLGKIEIAP